MRTYLLMRVTSKHPENLLVQLRCGSVRKQLAEASREISHPPPGPRKQTCLEVCTLFNSVPPNSGSSKTTEFTVEGPWVLSVSNPMSVTSSLG